MAYMSYCRFEGTLQELRICLGVVKEHVNEEAEYEVSAGEIKKFRSMVYDMVEFLQGQEILDEYGDLDKNKLDEICEKMAVAYDTDEKYERYEA